MRSLDINMMFWTDGLENSTRIRNIYYTSNKLKELSAFLNTQNIVCNIQIYDYSPTQILENSIHLPYPVGVYKRSEKINNLLKNCTADFFSIIDSDCFVVEQDYTNLANIIINADVNSCITFDLINLDTDQTNYIINTNIVDENLKADSRFPGRAGMLGGFFITNTVNLKKHNGFNTKFTTWGGEDGEIYDKIWQDGSIKKLPINRNEVKLYHLNHIVALEDINYFNREEYIKNNF